MLADQYANYFAKKYGLNKDEIVGELWLLCDKHKDSTSPYKLLHIKRDLFRSINRDNQNVIWPDETIDYDATANNVLYNELRDTVRKKLCKNYRHIYNLMLDGHDEKDIIENHGFTAKQIYRAKRKIKQYISDYSNID